MLNFWGFVGLEFGVKFMRWAKIYKKMAKFQIL